MIKYYNAMEDQPQFTDRSVRTIVKLWSVDEACLMDDLGELQRRYDNREAGHEHLEAEVNDDQGEDEQGDVADVTGLTQYQKNVQILVRLLLGC